MGTQKIALLLSLFFFNSANIYPMEPAHPTSPQGDSAEIKIIKWEDYYDTKSKTLSLNNVQLTNKGIDASLATLETFITNNNVEILYFDNCNLTEIPASLLYFVSNHPNIKTLSLLKNKFLNLNRSSNITIDPNQVAEFLQGCVSLILGEISKQDYSNQIIRLDEKLPNLTFLKTPLDNSTYKQKILKGIQYFLILLALATPTIIQNVIIPLFQSSASPDSTDTPVNIDTKT